MLTDGFANVSVGHAATAVVDLVVLGRVGRNVLVRLTSRYGGQVAKVHNRLGTPAPNVAAGARRVHSVRPVAVGVREA